jgi:hypothetical protein
MAREKAKGRPHYSAAQPCAVHHVRCFPTDLSLCTGRVSGYGKGKKESGHAFSDAETRTPTCCSIESHPLPNKERAVPCTPSYEFNSFEPVDTSELLHLQDDYHWDQ